MDIKQLILETPPLWERLQTAGKPIVLYGMGNGALKVMDACARYGIEIAAIFASDGFVRGHSFCGYRVQTLAEIEQMYDDFIILLGFGSCLSEVTARFYALNDRYELYAPDVPLADEQTPFELFTKDYALTHADALQAAYDLLADEQSRRVFLNTLRYKISGQIGWLRDCESPQEELWTLLPTGEREVYLDLGAYDGDTAYAFAARAKDYERIIALEPDPKNYKKLCKNLEKHPLERMTVLHVPIWDAVEEVAFDVTASRNSGIRADGANTVTAMTIDGILNGARVSYIKMDVEGAEARALRGGATSIKTHLPRLSISAYHRNEDLFALPLLVHELSPDYRIYLRHHPYVPAWETNLYCIAE